MYFIKQIYSNTHQNSHLIAVITSIVLKLAWGTKMAKIYPITEVYWLIQFELIIFILS